jgi:hypothetical protein
MFLSGEQGHGSPLVIAKPKAMQAFCPQRPPPGPARGRQVDAGPAAHHDPAGDDPAEALETTRIHSVAGLTGGRTALVTTLPCRAPHHPVTDAGLIGGAHVLTPGGLSLAHHVVRFLDEQPEFRRHVLEVSRQPLEERLI